jgi:hypothetical protein
MGELKLKDASKEADLREQFIDRIPKQMDLIERQLKLQWILLIISIIVLGIIGIVGVIR